MSHDVPATPSRAARLQALRNEPKVFDVSMYGVVLDALLDTMSRHQEKFQTKNAVLAQFRVTLKACRKAEAVDKERLCTWLERVMAIQGIESSDGMLDNWLNDIPF